MFEESGKRPVVYNNKCGQMCGVSIKTIFLSNLIIDRSSAVPKKSV
jgi:hypothetical protein